ncbi:hypothetical protein Dimus_024620 [Dionaea muscipula]
MVGWPHTLDAHVGDSASRGGDRLNLNARMDVLLARSRVFKSRLGCRAEGFIGCGSVATQGSCWPQLSCSHEAPAGRELLLQDS